MKKKEEFLILSQQLKECLEEDTVLLYRLNVDHNLMEKKQVLSDKYLKMVYEFPKEEIHAEVLEMERAFMDNCGAIDQCLKFHKRMLDVMKSNETISYSHNGTLNYRSKPFYQGEES